MLTNTERIIMKMKIRLLFSSCAKFLSIEQTQRGCVQNVRLSNFEYLKHFGSHFIIFLTTFYTFILRLQYAKKTSLRINVVFSIYTEYLGLVVINLCINIYDCLQIETF